jgi:hypothetical protein
MKIFQVWSVFYHLYLISQRAILNDQLWDKTNTTSQSDQ